MSTTIQKLKTLVEAAQKDADAFYGKGNQAAGTRLRKTYQEIKKLAQAGRVEVTETKATSK